MKETRIHKRVPYRVKLWCYRYYQANGEMVPFESPVSMEVFDLSLSGMGIVTQQALPDNATLEFTLYLEDIPYQVMTQIKWSTTNTVFYRYGLEIIGHNNMLFRHLQRFAEGKKITES